MFALSGVTLLGPLKTKPNLHTQHCPEKQCLNIGRLGTVGCFLLVGTGAAFSTSGLPEVVPESHRCRALSRFWDPVENGNYDISFLTLRVKLKVFSNACF